MSSPPPHMSFEGLLGESKAHILSSPIQSSFPYYDPISPYNTLRKTPTDNRIRSRLRTNDGFLVSPLAPSSSHSLGQAIHATPNISFMAHPGLSDTPVTIADPNSAPDWHSMDMAGLGGLPTDGIDMSAFENHSMAYGSPYKMPRQASTAVLHVPTADDVTPHQSPVMATVAPPTAKKGRTVSGLGTPTGVHRSAKRIRQATYDIDSMPVSPSAQRRRTDPTSSLTTSQPLSRAVSSSSFLAAPHFTQDRVLSSSSIMTTSTSYESCASPNIAMYGHEYQIMPSTGLPELVGSHSQNPSPNISLGGRSPLATPRQPSTVFYASPENEQGVFHSDRQEMSLIGQVSQVMSNPNSATMGSIASFQGHQYRQGTLSTIVETPLIPQEQMQYQQMPSQPDMSSQPHFQPVDYPPVPGLNMGYPHAGPMDIHAWSAQTYADQASLQQYYYDAQSQMPPAPQRNASTSFLDYQPPANSVRVFPNVPRSVSAPYIQTMSSMPSMANMPSALAFGGLFGPSSQAESSIMAREQNDSSQPPLPPLPPYHRVPGTLSSPDTPKKRQAFPPVGKRLRPGPKPKPKTPKKGGKIFSSPEPGQGTLDPSLLAGSSSMSNIDEEPPFDGENDLDAEDAASPLSPKPALVIGPDLSSVSIPSQRRPVQPQLMIQPPRMTITIDGQPASGLPRTFLEKLYTTFLTLDGSMTGQPVKRFKCLIEGCERHFPRKSAIHSHIQTHLEDKPFVCYAEDWYVLSFPGPLA